MNLPPYLMPLLMQAMGPQAQTVQNMQAMPQMMGAFANGGRTRDMGYDRFRGQENWARQMRGLAPGQEPMMGIGDALSAVPVVGDAVSAGMAMRDLYNGDYKSAALGALGVLPFVPGLAGTVGKVGRSDALRSGIDAIAQKYPDVKLSAYPSGDDKMVLSQIVVPKEARSSGIGSKVMRDLTELADREGLTIALTPSSDFGGNVSRLRNFYGRFDFVPNKGRNRDFSISEDMLRAPKTIATNTGALRDVALPITGARDVEGFANGGHIAGVQPDSFVIPADVVSALGEGSTDAGAEMLRMQFGGRLIDGDGTGRSDDVPASGPGMVMRFSRGEYLLPPEAVEAAGGHDALSKLVQSIRDRYARTLENIPAPQR